MDEQNTAKTPRTLYGVAASPGIIIGRVVRVNGAGGHGQRLRLAPEDVVGEEARFNRAVERAEQELVTLRDQLRADFEGPVGIIDSHILMLRDPMVHSRTIQGIGQETVNAEWALEMAMERARAVFDRIADPYIRERFRDVEHVAERLLGFWPAKRRTPWPRWARR